MMNNSKFKANPYNSSNHLITHQGVVDILQQVNISNFKPKTISFYQEAFIHKSYNFLEDYKEYSKPDNCL